MKQASYKSLPLGILANGNFIRRELFCEEHLDFTMLKRSEFGTARKRERGCFGLRLILIIVVWSPNCASHRCLTASRVIGVTNRTTGNVMLTNEGEAKEVCICCAYFKYVAGARVARLHVNHRGMP